MKNLNNIQREIVLDILNTCIEELEKDNLYLKGRFNYGNFLIEIQSTFYISIYDNDLELLSQIFCKFSDIYIWNKDETKREKQIINKLYKLLKNRDVLIERYKLLEENKKWISMIPEEKQKQLYRNVKLERIVGKNEN